MFSPAERNTKLTHSDKAQTPSVHSFVTNSVFYQYGVYDHPFNLLNRPPKKPFFFLESSSMILEIAT